MHAYRDLLLPEFDPEMANTRKLLECVPDDHLTWKPHEKSFTLGRLTGHVAEMPNWAARILQHDSFRRGSGDAAPYTPYVAASREEAVSRFDAAAAEAHDLISSTPNDAFEKTWTFYFADKPMFAAPRIQILRTMFLNHLIHHRAQMSVYLRLLNVPIPGMYGPSADVSAEATAAAIAARK